MPRRPRDFSEGIFHLAPRASDTRRLFIDDDERSGFLDALASVVETYELRLIAYTLMGTHYHVVVYTPGGRISKALQRLHTRYSRCHVFGAVVPGAACGTWCCAACHPALCTAPDTQH